MKLKDGCKLKFNYFEASPSAYNYFEEVMMINIDEIIANVKDEEFKEANEQTMNMEREDVDVLGPMNMLAFDL
ncbi:hypothetical protein [Dickeya zeae]|uniref:hypothetical protein n=1 Tax=Dickeya zeae TaxID=204042 RepID=UPI0012688D3A